MATLPPAFLARWPPFCVWKVPGGGVRDTFLSHACEARGLVWPPRSWPRGGCSPPQLFRSNRRTACPRGLPPRTLGRRRGSQPTFGFSTSCWNPQRRPRGPTPPVRAPQQTRQSLRGGGPLNPRPRSLCDPRRRHPGIAQIRRTLPRRGWEACWGNQSITSRWGTLGPVEQDPALRSFPVQLGEETDGAKALSSARFNHCVTLESFLDFSGP